MRTRRFWLRLQTLLHRNRSAQRLNDEIQFHLDQQIAENLAAGMSPEEARYAAMRAFGNPTFLKEETWFEQIGQDFAVVIILVPLAACLIPAYRATCIDPNSALRYE